MITQTRKASYKNTMATVGNRGRHLSSHEIFDAKEITRSTGAMVAENARMISQLRNESISKGYVIKMSLIVAAGVSVGPLIQHFGLVSLVGPMALAAVLYANVAMRIK